MRAPQPSDDAFIWHLPPSLVWLLRRPHLNLFFGIAVAIVVQWARGRASSAVAVELLAAVAFAAGGAALILYLLTTLPRRR